MENRETIDEREALVERLIEKRRNRPERADDCTACGETCNGG